MALNVKKLSYLQFPISRCKQVNYFKSCLNNKSRSSTVSEHICSISRGFGTTVPRFEMFNVQDEDDFKEKVIKSETPVVVDFHAHWCGPCKVLGPRLENIIGGKGDKVHLAKIDIDSVSDLALEYGVSAVPSVLGIKDGKVVDKFVGVQEENRIDAFVNKLIGE